MTTYHVTPNDTLFFRGGEPMGMGESHFQTSVFPPSPETFIGAVRTSVIVHKGDGDFEGYKNGTYNDTSWFKEIGLKELPNTFQFTGPFVIKDKDILLPAPGNLFTDADKKGFVIASPRDFQEITHSKDNVDSWYRGNDGQRLEARRRIHYTGWYEKIPEGVH
jgi:CRISPR type III-B/RAMP module-associated protein Cmr3